MQLIFDEDNIPAKELCDKFEEAVKCCLLYENIEEDNIEVSVSFVSPEEIQEINREHRNIDSVTDVLSFPQFDDIEEMLEAAKIQPAALGDVVICTERAKEQAEEYGHSIEREMVYLFVHSIFHLLGYDHMIDEEKQEMRVAEETVMSKLGLERL